MAAKAKKEQTQEVKVLQLPVDEANAFISIMGIILVGDDRLTPLRQHFLEIIQRNNEEDKK